MKITDLLRSAFIPSAAKEMEPLQLSEKPNQITPHTLFFLTEGVNYDKTNLLPFILAKKPMAIVVPTDTRIDNQSIPIIYTENVRRAYAEAFYLFCGLNEAKMKYIAVTGTNGKTTTATMLKEILRQSGISTGFIGTGKILCDDLQISSSYYSMTTPDPEVLYPALTRMAAHGCEYVVMEASSHALALDKLSPIRFDAAIFTNLSAEHLDFHPNMEGYYQAKARLFKHTKLAILNNDDPFGRRLAEECSCRVLRVGALFASEISAKNVVDHGFCGCSYMYVTDGPKFFVHLNIPGIYHVYNSMLALGTAIAMGIAPCKAKKYMERIREIPGRLHCIEKTDISVYVDYAHTPKALACTLKEASDTKCAEGALWVIFGCGGERDREKRPKMAEVAERLSDQVILTLDNCRGESPMQILKDTVKGFSNREKAHVITNRGKAIRHAILAMNPGDILIIAGKGIETYTIDKKGYHPFDERKIILNALKERKGGHTLLYENQIGTPHFSQGN